MRDRADVVVIGGGILGLSIAYHLAKEQGTTDVTVVERSYLCSGASGRNGGGVRAQWSTLENVRLMQESVRLFRDFARETGINVWFRQGGYLFLARSDERVRGLEESVELQREAGLSTRLLSPDEARSIVPELSVDGVVAASFHPEDGVVFPWPLVWGYAEAARRLGVEIATFTDVVGIRTTGKRIDSVVTSRGELRTRRVVVACGAWSPRVAALAGVELPNRPRRHEICVTEPLGPWLAPLVADLDTGLYFSQSMRGEIVGGISGDDVDVDPDDPRSSIEFLGRYARALTEVCPRLGAVSVLRQWAGFYDVTPDHAPIVGTVDEVDELWQASGFIGHGFMMAPAVGRRIARAMASGVVEPPLDRFRLSRFRDGETLRESMIIG